MTIDHDGRSIMHSLLSIELANNRQADVNRDRHSYLIPLRIRRRRRFRLRLADALVSAGKRLGADQVNGVRRTAGA